MKLAVVVLASVLLIPLAFAAGYAMHKEPEPEIASVLLEKLKLEEGTSDTVYIYFVTKGPLKGQTADAVQILATMTRADLIAAGALEGVYVKVDCANYSTTGQTLALNAESVQHCKTTKTTEQAVREYAQSLAQPPLAS